MRGPLRQRDGARMVWGNEFFIIPSAREGIFQTGPAIRFPFEPLMTSHSHGGCAKKLRHGPFLCRRRPPPNGPTKPEFSRRAARQARGKAGDSPGPQDKQGLIPRFYIRRPEAAAKSIGQAFGRRFCVEASVRQCSAPQAKPRVERVICTSPKRAYYRFASQKALKFRHLHHTHRHC